MASFSWHDLISLPDKKESNLFCNLLEKAVDPIVKK